MKRVVFLLLILFSCQKTPLPSSKQQLNLCIATDPATLDPRQGGDATSAMFHFLIYDGLTRYTDTGKIELSLAERVDLSDDKKTYTFTLKPASWSDGSPITAEDFETSWKSLLDPTFPSPNAHLLYPIKNAEAAKKGLVPISAVGVHAGDAHTLIVQLEHPIPYFLELISFCTFFPLSPKNPSLFNGPFVLEHWKHNNEILLTKNPHYHASQRVHLEAIHLSIVAAEGTALQMYEKGQLDLLGLPSSALPTDAIATLIQKGELQIRPLAATTFCTFNVGHPPFHNVKIRKAFALAINRQEITSNITQLGEEPAYDIIPPSIKKTSSPSNFQDHDLLNARILLHEGLEELGLKELPKITFIYSNTGLHHKIAQALQQQWQTGLGIKVDLLQVEHKTLIDHLKNRDYQFGLSFWIAQYSDPMSILERFKIRANVKNYPDWENPTFVNLLERSFTANTAEERNQLLMEAESIFINDMPLTPIFHWNSAFLAKPYVRRADLAPLGNSCYEEIILNK